MKKEINADTTVEDVKNVLSLWGKEFSRKEIERLLGMSQTIVTQIIKNYELMVGKQHDMVWNRYNGNNHPHVVEMLADAIGYTIHDPNLVIEEPEPVKAEPVPVINEHQMKELLVSIHYLSKQLSILIEGVSKIPEAITENRKVIDADFDVLIGEITNVKHELERKKF